MHVKKKMEYIIPGKFIHHVLKILSLQFNIIDNLALNLKINL